MPLALAFMYSMVLFVRILSKFPYTLDGCYRKIESWERLTAEQTEAYFENLGVTFFLQSGHFFYLVFEYLCQVGNLNQVFLSDLSTFDRDTLVMMLRQLRFLIVNHELLYSLITNLCPYYDTDIPFDYNVHELHGIIRDGGNNLITFYRCIERELGIENSDLPNHWTEN